MSSSLGTETSSFLVDEAPLMSDERCVAPLISPSVVCCRIFGKKLHGPHDSEEGSPADAWLAALQQAKASTGMSRDVTRGLLTAIHQRGTQQEEMKGDLWAGEQMLRFEVDEAVRLLISLAHAPEPLFGYKSTRWWVPRAENFRARPAPELRQCMSLNSLQLHTEYLSELTHLVYQGANSSSA